MKLFSLLRKQTVSLHANRPGTNSWLHRKFRPYVKIGRLSVKRGLRLNRLSSSRLGLRFFEARPEIQQLSDAGRKRPGVPHDDGSLGR